MKTSFGLLSCLLLAVTSLQAQEIDPDELPREEITLSTGKRVYNVVHLNRNWRETDEQELVSSARFKAEDICFEAKFDALEKGVLKLLRNRGHVICKDPVKLRYIETLRRGDNVWICGSLRPREEQHGVELLLFDIVKLDDDLARLRARFQRLKDRNDAQALMKLGNEINELAVAAVSIDFGQHDNFLTLRNSAWSAALESKEAALAADDAQGRYELAMQWYDLLRRTQKYRDLIRAALSIDPNHAQAARIAADRMSMIRVGNIWMTRTEHERWKQDEQQKRERTNEQEAAALKALEEQRSQAMRERYRLLTDHRIALRTDEKAAFDGALRSLGEAVQRNPDVVFGIEAVALLAGFDPGENLYAAFALACASTLHEVRWAAYEALAWHRTPQALTLLGNRLSEETHALTGRAAVEALIKVGGRPALETLMLALKNEDADVRLEIMEGLTALTRQRFSKSEEWSNWWKTQERM